MTLSYEILLQGNSLRLKEGFLGLSTVVLIRSPKETILFDTGGYVTRLGLLQALGRARVDRAEIDAVFLSHLHFDHCQNIDLFPHAKFFVSKGEWDYAAAPHKNDLFMPWGIREQLEKYDLTLIEGHGAIVSGVEFFPAPGHTPGCYALELQTAESGRVIIAGDAIKYPKEAFTRTCDGCFDTIEAWTASADLILDQADRIVPGHFPELVRLPSGGFTWKESASVEFLIR
jgi:glyoxylase-like metal-dependent hydrolase (beta-lactamase superfamily II)